MDEGGSEKPRHSSAIKPTFGPPTDDDADLQFSRYRQEGRPMGSPSACVSLDRSAALPAPCCPGCQVHVHHFHGATSTSSSQLSPYDAPAQAEWRAREKRADCPGALTSRLAVRLQKAAATVPLGPHFLVDVAVGTCSVCTVLVGRRSSLVPCKLFGRHRVNLTQGAAHDIV